jgi:hypothetical protein
MLALWLFVKELIPSLLAYLTKKQDVDLEKYKVDGTVDVAAISAETEIVKARAALVAALKDDPVLRWGRRLFIYPVGVWFALIVYDSAFRNILPKGWTWTVLALPQNLEYVIYVITGFLFIHSWIKK